MSRRDEPKNTITIQVGSGSSHSHPGIRIAYNCNYTGTSLHLHHLTNKVTVLGYGREDSCLRRVSGIFRTAASGRYDRTTVVVTILVRTPPFREQVSLPQRTLHGKG